MRRRLIVSLAAGLLALPFFALPAAAKLLIQIDKGAQVMTVSQDGVFLHQWPVSTGIARYDTPGGAYKPFRMEKDHFSVEWDDAPMPYSIFFTTKGHAIHGTHHKSLGRPASHGCVRLSVKDAATLWSLVKRAKMANTEVVLFGRVPDAAPVVAGSVRELAAAPSHQRRWSNGPVTYEENGRTYYQDNSRAYREMPPAYVPERRYDRYGDGYGPPPVPFPFFLFGR
jgi:hypothetical protein